MNGNFQSYLDTLQFNNGEQLEDFHSRILILQQKFIFSDETVSPTRLLFHYMKALSEIEKLKSFISSKIKHIIKSLDNN